MFCHANRKPRWRGYFPSKNVKPFLNRSYQTGGRRERYGEGKVLTLTSIPSPTRVFPVHMGLQFSRLNWPLADSNETGWACYVIPFSIIVASYNMATILRASSVIWFAIVPLLIIFFLRAVIKPIKFAIRSPIQPNPSRAVAASIPQQVVNKLVFILWFNHSKVCSQILTKSPWIDPCWGRRCNVIAGFSVYHEACWTSICSEIRL